MNRRVLVTGGTGFVGSHVVEAYLSAGWSVRALVRNPARAAWIRSLPIDIVLGSFADGASLRSALNEVQVVVHCAAVTKTTRRNEYYRVNAEAVQQLAAAAVVAGVGRFVLCSSHAASGPAQDGVASHESDPPHPLSDYGKSKLEGEQLLKRFAKQMEWVILRPPSVIGPRDQQFVPLFRAVARYGVYPKLGAGNQRYSFVYVKDLARVLLLAGETARRVNEVYFVANDEPLDWQMAAGLIAGFANRRPRAVAIPAVVARGLGRLNDMLASISGRPALVSSDKVQEMLAAGWICSTEKIHAAWDFSCNYTTSEALRETYEFYRQTNRL
jgi:nucleoside-diphosphate-sugar epimerase